MTDTISMPVLPLLPGISLSSSQKTIPFPTNKTAVQSTKKIIPKPKSSKIVVPKESSPVIITQEQTLHNDVNNKLQELGYLVIHKISSPKHKFLKVINRKGQKVYIYTDNPLGFTEYDIMMIESDNNPLSHSIKNGAYKCVGIDVSGVLFEYGINSICTIMRGENDLKFNETNYVLHNNTQTHPFEGSVITYPIINLNDLLVNPDIILLNTDVVTRRLRNTEDSYERQELTRMDVSLEQFNESLYNFKEICNNSTHKLMLFREQINNIEGQYNEDLQRDLIKSNDDIIKLICVMRKVASKRREMENITHEIEELTNYLSTQI